MNIRRIVPVIETTRLEESKRFYGDFLGLTAAMDLGWVVNYVSASNETAQVIVVKSDRGAVAHPGHSVSVEVGDADFDAAYEKASDMGWTISYPRTKEPWGVERFFVLDPNGVTVNIMHHI